MDQQDNQTQPKDNPEIEPGGLSPLEANLLLESVGLDETIIAKVDKKDLTSKELHAPSNGLLVLSEKSGIQLDRLSHILGALETIIFMSSEPVAIGKFKKLVDEKLPTKTYRKLLEFMMEGYESPIHGISSMAPTCD